MSIPSPLRRATSASLTYLASQLPVNRQGYSGSSLSKIGEARNLSAHTVSVECGFRDTLPLVLGVGLVQGWCAAGRRRRRIERQSHRDRDRERNAMRCEGEHLAESGKPTRQRGSTSRS